MTRAKTGRRKMPIHYWTEAEMAVLRERYPTTKTATLAAEMGIGINAVLNMAYRNGINKTAAYLSAAARANGSSGRFVKGQAAWNKGIPFRNGGRSVETQFKPGLAVYNHRPVGSTRISVDGYVEIKIAEPRKWGQLHRETWKAHHGSYPPYGMALVFRDGNKQRCNIENLELITRTELMRRNSIHQYGPEMAQLAQLRGAITRQINRREKHV